jgi:hypothetical protein
LVLLVLFVAYPEVFFRLTVSLNRDVAVSLAILPGI